MRRLALIFAGAALAVAGTAQAALYGYDDSFWGNSIGSVVTSGGNVVISLDPATATTWVNDPSQFYGVAIAPNAPSYYGNYMMMGSGQTWMHQILTLNFSDSTTQIYDVSGGDIKAAMIAPVDGTTGAPASVGPDINFTAGPLGMLNGPYLDLYGWTLTSADVGKTVTSATVSIQSWWGESGLTLNAYKIPVSWSQGTVTYNNLVPEPATLSIVLVGALGLLRRSRHR